MGGGYLPPFQCIPERGAVSLGACAKVSIPFLLKLGGSTSYGLPGTANHQFSVLALQEAAQAGCNHPYE